MLSDGLRMRFGRSWMKIIDRELIGIHRARFIREMGAEFRCGYNEDLLAKAARESGKEHHAYFGSHGVTWGLIYFGKWFPGELTDYFDTAYTEGERLRRGGALSGGALKGLLTTIVQRVRG